MTPQLTATQKIWLENIDLMKPWGTGIATYANTLARVLQPTNLEALVETAHALPKSDPCLAEVLLHDTGGSQTVWDVWRQRYLQQPAHLLMGSPWGLRPTSTWLSAEVEHPLGAAASPLQWYKRVSGAPQIRFQAGAHFARWGQFLTVKPHTQPHVFQPHVFHATHPIALHVKGAAHLVTVHDLVPRHLPWATHDQKKLYLKLIRKLCKTADHILTVSEFVRRDLIAFTGMAETRVTNTAQGMDLPSPDELANRQTAEAIVDHAYGLTPDNYFLFYGAAEPKKNLSRLVDAYLESGCPQPLVVVAGPGWGDQQATDRMRAEHLFSWQKSVDAIQPHRRIRLLPYLARRHVTALTRCARALLFPSLHEGFGLPIVEAMAWGCPVLTANRAAMPEVAGGAALLVDPTDTGAIAKGIKMLGADPDLRASLHARGLERSQAFGLSAYQGRLAQIYSSFC